MKNVIQMIEDRKYEIIDFTRRLVEIPTVNAPPNGNELPGQLLYEQCCREAGLEVHTLNPRDVEGFETSEAFLKNRDFTDRYNVIGIWKGNGQGKSLLLSGHMDVVPEEPQPWTMCKPFEPVIRDGRLYGRGSADMKGGLAAALMAVTMLKESGWSPSGDILVESVVDEEYAGANGTIASRMAGFNADFAINPEPTGLAVYPACVGALIFKILIRGTAGMPYTAAGGIYNPIFGITKVIDIVKSYEHYRNSNESVHPQWEAAPYNRSIIITKVKAGEVQEHGQLGVPIDAWLEVIVQTFPGESEQSAKDRFMDYFRRHAADIPELATHSPVFEKMYRYVEPAECSLDHAGIHALKQSVSRVIKQEATVVGAPFSCDLAAFQMYGNTPAVVFGPTGDNLHAPNEWVDTESIVTAAKVYAEMIMNWCE